MKSLYNRQEGSALIIVMSVLIIVIGLGGSLLMTSVQHHKLTRSYEGLVLAQYAAKGGLQLATILLNDQADSTDKPVRMEGQMEGQLPGQTTITVWESTIYTTQNSFGVWKRLKDGSLVNGTGTTPADQIFNVKDLALTQRGNRHFRVLVDSNPPSNGGSLSAAVAYRVTSYANYDRVGYAVEGYINQSVRTEQVPGFTGYKSIKISGNGVVDSYKSVDGEYASMTPNGLNELNHGDLGTNGTLTIQGAQTPMVYGDVKYGVALIGDAVEGQKIQMTTDELLPQPDKLFTDWKNGCPDASVNTLIDDTAGTMLVSQKNGHLKEVRVMNPSELGTIGTESSFYYGSVTLAGTLSIAGEVTMYIRGDFSSAGGIADRILIQPGGKLHIYVGGSFSFTGRCEGSNTPDQFFIYSTADQRDSSIYPVPAETSETGFAVKMAGNTAVKAVVYAPFANVKIAGNSDFYGAAVGNTVTITGSLDSGSRAKVHYDESFRNTVISTSYYLHSSVKTGYRDTP